MEEFKKWLIRKKGFSTKGAGDVVSRLRRLMRIAGKNDITKVRLADAGKKEEYKELSVYVTSQLKRAYALYSEYYDEL